MPQHEHRDVRGQLGADEGGHVGEDARRRPRLAPVAVLRRAPSPSPLVHAVHSYPVLREVREEAVVPIHVVAEAVDHDHLSFNWALGL